MTTAIQIRNKVRKAAEKIVPRDRFCTVKEISEWFGFSKKKIYGDIKKKRLPAVRIGRMVRISGKNIIDYIVSHTYIPKGLAS